MGRHTDSQPDSPPDPSRPPHVPFPLDPDDPTEQVDITMFLDLGKMEQTPPNKRRRLWQRTLGVDR